MSKSIAQASTRKRAKPSKDWPFFWHRSGTWAKKVNGRIVYLSADDQLALELWETQQSDIRSGKPVRRDGFATDHDSDGITVSGLCNDFLDYKNADVQTGELTESSFRDYLKTCRRIVRVLGRHALVEKLKPSDFARLRGDITRTRKAKGTSTEITRIRSVFNFGVQQGLLGRPPAYGVGLKKPKQRTVRIERQRKGRCDLTAEQIQTLLDIAGQPMRSMILLGINLGFGNGDCGQLPISAIDGNRVTFWRPKTGTNRIGFLWPETTASLDEWFLRRPDPKNSAHSDLVFITKRGGSFHREDGKANPISAEFKKLLEKAGMYRDGLGFYSLRRSFETQSGSLIDQVATNMVMGHIPASHDMASVYRQHVDDSRILAVINHVRDWLFDGVPT